MPNQVGRTTQLHSAQLATILIICLTIIVYGSSQTVAAQRNPCLADSGVPLNHPTEGEVIGRFGFHVNPVTRQSRFNPGIAYRMKSGEAVRAAGIGRVKERHGGSDGEFDVVIDHGKGLDIRYTKLAKIELEVGQCVGSADSLGSVGETDGAHGGQFLHVEVRRNGVLVDPLGVFRERRPSAPAP
jgi:murein DD-endopeptidase MepM/ murein hydrolase activator NlpD